MVEEKQKPLLMVNFMLKKNTYFHKYQEPFVIKNLDDAMFALSKTLLNRKKAIRGKIYCEFAGESDTLSGPTRDADYFSYVATIGTTEEDIFESIKQPGIYAPAVVDVLKGLWFSIKNNEEIHTTKEGKVLHNIVDDK